MIDGYFLEDQLLWNEPNRTGFVSRGCAVACAGLENASVETRNQLEDEWRVILRGIPPDCRCQLYWRTDNDYGDVLDHYYKQTVELPGPEGCTQMRNERSVRNWKAADRAALRRSRLTVSFGYPLARVSSKGRGIEKLLGVSKTSLDQRISDFAHSIGNLGGSVQAYTDLDHYEELFRWFNPSRRSFSRSELEASFDPLGSVLENCMQSDAAPFSRPDAGFILDGYYHSVLVLKSIPLTTYSGMMLALTSLPLTDYAITVTIRPLDLSREIEAAEAQIKKLRHALAHSSGQRMRSAIETKLTKLDRLMSNQVVPFKAQFVIRAWDEGKDGLLAKITALKSAVTKLGGAKYYHAAFSQTARNYFLASMPGWCFDPYDDYTHYIEDHNLANLLPFPGEPDGDLMGAEALYDGGNGNLIGIKTFNG